MLTLGIFTLESTGPIGSLKYFPKLCRVALSQHWRLIYQKCGYFNCRMKPDGEVVVEAGPQYVAVQDTTTSQPTLVQIGTSQIIKQALDK